MRIDVEAHDKTIEIRPGRTRIHRRWSLTLHATAAIECQGRGLYSLTNTEQTVRVPSEVSLPVSSFTQVMCFKFTQVMLRIIPFATRESPCPKPRHPPSVTAFNRSFRPWCSTQ